MRKKILSSLFFLCIASFAMANGAEYCVTNSYGEQASLVLSKTSPGNYDVSGSYDYTIFGGLIWPVRGTYSCTTGQLHFVATNPEPDNCTFWATTVTFDYTVTGLSLSGGFSNDCGVAGSLGAAAVKGSCGFAKKPILKEGEFGTTGSHKMNRSKLALPKGENLQELLKEKPVVIAVSPNPAKQFAQISFKLDYATKIQVKIYDQKGNIITTLADAKLGAGSHSYNWNLKSQKAIDVPKGVYWIRVTTDAGTVSKQILIER